jgi:AraC-like DNA-binding protein
MTGDPHLVLKELVLLPSGEWFTQSPGWVVVRVAAGAGYWLHQGMGRDFRVGDMVVAESNCGGTVRASSLGPITLQFFVVQPRLLNGLLAVTEWRQLVKGTSAPPQPVFSSASEPFAQRFTELAVQPARSGLPMRCRLLQLWVDAVAGLVGETSRVAEAGELRDRFLQMLGRLSEAELSVSSLSDLSQRLHCSGRHFSRLFQEEFGTAFRVRQIEMRLLRAQQMLAESDAKIIHVAYESGYKNLGPFNAMFKKHFRMTPSQWRRRSRKAGQASHSRPSRFPTRAAVFLLAWLLCYSFSHICNTSPLPRQCALAYSSSSTFS